jgi:hypothetical protein
MGGIMRKIAIEVPNKCSTQLDGPNIPCPFRLWSEESWSCMFRMKIAQQGKRKIIKYRWFQNLPWRDIKPVKACRDAEIRREG